MSQPADNVAAAFQIVRDLSAIETVYQILPQPIHAPVIWKICDPRGNLIGSAASFVDAKLWCEKRPRHEKGFRII